MSVPHGGEAAMYVVVGVGIIIDPGFPLVKQWINSNEKYLTAAIKTHFEGGVKSAPNFVLSIHTTRNPPPGLQHVGDAVIPLFPDESEVQLAPPSERAARSLDDSRTHMATESCEYHKYRSGTDALGAWCFHPLGLAVKDAFVSVSRAAAGQTEDIEFYMQEEATSAPRRGDGDCVDDVVQRVALHHLLRFVHHHISSMPTPSVPWLDRQVVDHTLGSLVHLIDNKVNFQVVESIFRRMTYKAAAAPRGLLVWGPPGTGKTVFSQRVAEATGLVPVREGKGFAAGELRHGLQGGSERNVAAMLLRANACPWLMFSVVIDEVETLVPKRGDSNSGSSEQSTLGVMLTYFGGLKDVPNVFIFGLTNHKANLDAAFTRRMTGKLFLGVPSAVTRMTWSTSNHFHISMKLRTLMADLTVNFSGANMKELMEELHMKCLSASASHVTETMLRETVQLVSKSEHVLICGMTPVELAHRSKLASTSYQSTMDNDFECIAKLIASCPSQWTGRIFVSCGVPPRAIHALEGPYVDLQRNDGTVHTMRCQWGCQKPAAIATACARTAADSMLNMTPRYMLKKDNVRTLLMTLSQSLNASFVRIVDAAYFYSDRCSGEASMMHELAEIMGQSREYDRCIVALDMDTVVLSPAVDSNRPLHFSSLLHQMLSIVEDSSRMSEDLSSFLIIVVVSSSESCTQRFKDKLRWPENEACDFALQKSFGLDLAQTLPSLSNPERHQTLCVKGLSNATTATPVWCNACGVPVAALPAVLRSDDPVVVVSDEASINASSASAVSCRVCTECEALVPAGFETLGVAMCPVCVGRNITRGAMDIFEQGCCELDKQPLYLWWRETAFDELMLKALCWRQRISVCSLPGGLVAHVGAAIGRSVSEVRASSQRKTWSLRHQFVYVTSIPSSWWTKNSD